MPAGYGYDSHLERWKINTRALSDVLGADRSQTYSLYHAMGIYENQRLASWDKRVVNLTRSSYAGQQRYGTITWNGDTYASWKTFAQMIPAGSNFMATGCPYWTIDVGAFFVSPDRWNRWFCKGEYPEGCNDLAYRELYTRMFQFATFLPMLRSHGTDTPRKVWRFGNPGEFGGSGDQAFDEIWLGISPGIFAKEPSWLDRLLDWQERGGWQMDKGCRTRFGNLIGTGGY